MLGGPVKRVVYVTFAGSVALTIVLSSALTGFVVPRAAITLSHPLVVLDALVAQRPGATVDFEFVVVVNLVLGAFRPFVGAGNAAITHWWGDIVRPLLGGPFISVAVVR
jgi:hypothetical protein